MISIKKYIGSYDEELLNAMALAYCKVLESAGKNAERAVPGAEHPLSRNLSKIQDQLLEDPKPAIVLRTQQAVDEEFRQWADSIEQHLRSKACEAREIMLVMANAAQNLGKRDQRYVRRFSDLTSRLKKIADLDDLSDLRQSIMASASELSAEVQSMEAEGQRTIANLKIKLEGYQNQLAEAERRGCLDALTGLLNRRGIELAMAKRSEAKIPYCVVMLDLDSFKPVNDNYGHSAGDDLLTQFSVELHAHCRSTDLIGRWGGDEFIILMTGDRSDAQNCADRIRRWAFGTYKVKTARGTCPIELSASVGIAVWDLQEDAAQLLTRADQSMYAQKRARNP
jgi:diguanylate cyclase (GGDEF)-like protein